MHNDQLAEMATLFRLVLLAASAPLGLTCIRKEVQLAMQSLVSVPL